MNEQNIQLTSLTWWLIAAWVAFVAVTFVAGWSWIAVNARQYKPSSALAKAILIRSIPLALVHLIWMTAILLSTSIKRENLLCLWIGVPLFLGFVYLNLYAGYRQLRRMEETESQQSTLKSQEKR